MGRRKPLVSVSTSDNAMVTELRALKKPLTVKQLAEIIPFSIFTIYQWAQDNKIPHMRLGGKVLFDPQKTADWLKERCA